MFGSHSSSEDSRGQTQTLESISASLFLMLVVTIIVQSITVTPSVNSIATEEIEGSTRQIADDTLDVGVQQNNVLDLVLYYSTSQNQFYNAGDAGVYESQPPTQFGQLLQESLGARGYSFNVAVDYMTANASDTNRKYIVYQGEPSSNSAIATRTLLVFDDMEITAPDTSTTVKDDSGFYMPDSQPNGDVYNVVTVRITVWRI